MVDFMSSEASATPMTDAMVVFLIFAAGFVQRRFVDALVLAPTPVAVLEGFESWVNPGIKWNNK